MTITLKPPRWYSWRNGVIEPCYELPKKSSPGMKAYSLKEARELKLLPSVTSVLSVVDKPNLNNHRVTQAIYSALTLPRLPGEGADAFAERVLIDSEEKSRKAREFGTRIHDAIAELMGQSMDKKQMFIPIDLYDFLDPFRTWAQENIEVVHAVEKPVGHPSVGVAGRLDIDCTLKDVGRTICDVKTQDVKDGKPVFWSDWCPQLSAYAECLTKELGSPSWTVPNIMSIVIPSNEPGPVHPKLWTREEQMNGWETFQAALTIWRHGPGRGYDPRQP